MSCHVMKWRQCLDMTIDVDWDVLKHLFKQTEVSQYTNGFKHNSLLI